MRNVGGAFGLLLFTSFAAKMLKNLKVFMLMAFFGEFALILF